MMPASPQPLETADGQKPMEVPKRRLANCGITSEKYERLKTIIN